MRWFGEEEAKTHAGTKWHTGIAQGPLCVRGSGWGKRTDTSTERSGICVGTRIVTEPAINDQRHPEPHPNGHTITHAHEMPSACPAPGTRARAMRNTHVTRGTSQGAHVHGQGDKKHTFMALSHLASLHSVAGFLNLTSRSDFQLISDPLSVNPELSVQSMSSLSAHLLMVTLCL